MPNISPQGPTGPSGPAIGSSGLTNLTGPTGSIGSAMPRVSGMSGLAGPGRIIQRPVDWSVYVEAVVADIFGAPNGNLSQSPDGVCFNGITINLKTGDWFNDEAETGGGLRELILDHVNVRDNDDAIIAYAEECRRNFENGKKPAPTPDEPPPEASAEALPEVDRSQLETFIRTVFKHATGGYVSLRTFSDKDRNKKPTRMTSVKHNGTNLDDLIKQAYYEAIRAAHNPKKAVFCPPTATFTNSKHAREIDLHEGLVLSIECDKCPREALTKLEALLGPATLVVHSGGEWTNPETGETEPKLHVYYLLKIPARGKDELKKLKQARALATKFVGGDASNVSIVHPIRWPGSVHRKGTPKLCRIVSRNDDVEIELDTALGILQKTVGEYPLSKTSTDKSVGMRETAEAFKHLPLVSLGVGIKNDLEEIRSAANAIPPEVIADEPNWMNLARALAWEAKGRPEDTEALWEILDTVSKKAPGYDKDDNRRKFDRYIDEAGGHEKPITIGTLFHLAYEHGWQRENSSTLKPGTSKPSTPITWNPSDLRVSYSNVPHRRWLYGPYLMRGEITLIGAPGGVGKTALTTGIATEIAVGTILMDEKIWGTDLKVLSINGEDSKTEVTRRMWAFARAHEHQIAVEAPERFYVIGADDERTQQMLFLQTNERNVSSLNLNGFAVLDSALAALRPDVVMLDPFVTFCSGGNMNDNTVMARVMQGLKVLAVKYDCAILIVHHTKKGGERGDQEAISGAASIVNLPRCALMPVPMTKEEATEFGVLPSERFRYFKLVNAKPNFTPKSEDSPWYQLHSVEIQNAEPPIYEYGDRVQAVTRVTLPLPKTASEAAIDPKIQRAILDLVHRGKLVDGVHYPYSTNVSGAKNMRALLDDAMAGVKDATAPRQWRSDDLRAVVHAAIDRMKVEGWLFEGLIKKGRFHGSSSMSGGRIPRGQRRLRRPMAAARRPHPRKSQPTRTKHPRTEPEPGSAGVF
jgi:AAA domain/Primase C terminal 2 (PriCT-2)